MSIIFVLEQKTLSKGRVPKNVDLQLYFYYTGNQGNRQILHLSYNHGGKPPHQCIGVVVNKKTAGLLEQDNVLLFLRRRFARTTP